MVPRRPQLSLRMPDGVVGPRDVGQRVVHHTYALAAVRVRFESIFFEFPGIPMHLARQQKRKTLGRLRIYGTHLGLSARSFE